MNNALNEASLRIAAGVGRALPGLLALLVALLVAVVFAVAARFLVLRFLGGIDFDRSMARVGMSGLAELSPRRSPALLVARGVFWLIVLAGLLVGVAALEPNLIAQLVSRVLFYLPNVIIAAVLILTGTFLARFAAQGVLISAVNMRLQSAHLVSTGVKWLVLVLATAMALDHLQIGGDIVRLAFAITFGGIVLALALAVGLGSTDMVRRSWDRQGAAEPERQPAERFHHL